MKYIKQIDALRAIAVFCVIFEHWNSARIVWIESIPFGAIGVDIFFALSGFLITQILLQSRTNEAGRWQSLKIFIARRTLRIFPIYYVTILGLSLFVPYLNNNLPYFLLYLSNFKMYPESGWVGPSSHLWSLAVEEQFYLIWPWLMLFLKRRYVFRTILIFIPIGVISKWAMFYFFPADYQYPILTFSCFDAFAIGGTLSYFLVYQKRKLPKFYNTFKILGGISLVALMVIIAFGQYKLWGRTFTAIGTVYLILFAMHSSERHWLLGNKSLLFIGKLSYGIYLFHNFIPGIYRQGLQALGHRDIRIPLVNAGIPASLQQQVGFLHCFLLLILFAWVSWMVIEKPFLKMKKYFEYRMPKPQKPVVRTRQSMPL